MKPPIPILRSFDEAKAREFYLDFLGFEVVFEHRFEPELPLYLAVRRGQCGIHLSEHHGDASPGAAIRIPMSEEELRAFHAELAAHESPMARPGIETKPWGLEVTVKDPFSNRLVFTTAE